jgi:hypothetical protein
VINAVTGQVDFVKFDPNSYDSRGCNEIQFCGWQLDLQLTANQEVTRARHRVWPDLSSNNADLTEYRFIASPAVKYCAREFNSTKSSLVITTDTYNVGAM